ncbi:type IV secretory pathway VirB3-like protein [Silvibacterium bohemicum]|uniref:Type IV secretory pathway VirB3-like protein n=1 Tax=Silvibacterium bohemicum TaxID=1577686 RepID=A0A841JNI6_9BACT|nr:hypothetical protein [Silvibacterium bohemicum]MBB6142813.1 type IV secretory pathway VirB3-like protein [Silvibacterium bohemicum]
MTVPPLLALLLWIPVSLFFCSRYSLRTAFVLIFIGGWAVLPAAHYTPTSDPLPYWILGTGIATDYFITKATVIGFCGLLGFFLFDRHAIRRFQLTLWDMPMLLWCMAPVLSGIANALPLGEMFRAETYQLLAWGVPYFIGRLYFCDSGSLRFVAQAFVIAGLFYVPICLFEIWKGPQLYAHIYGYLPYRWVGAQRYIGYRPIGLLENGNQLGIWMATAALVATWFWAKRIIDRVCGIPIAIVAITLLVTTFLCQSAGSILLLFILLPFVFVSHRTFPRAIAIFIVVGIIFFAGLRLTNVVSLRSLVQHNPAAHATAAFLKEIGRGSLGWRLGQDERHVSIALDRPILGYGEWDWWRRGTLRPWGLWLLGFGMYGILGLVALEALQVVPVIRAIWFPLTKSDIEYLNLRHALAAAILITAVDNLLNSSMILPLLLVMGGMSTWKSAAAEVSVTVDIGPELLEELAPAAHELDWPSFEPENYPVEHLEGGIVEAALPVGKRPKLHD